MTTKIRDVLRAIETIAPRRYAASWDNVGLLVDTIKEADYTDGDKLKV